MRKIFYLQSLSAIFFRFQSSHSTSFKQPRLFKKNILFKKSIQTSVVSTKCDPAVPLLVYFPNYTVLYPIYASVARFLMATVLPSSQDMLFSTHRTDLFLGPRITWRILVRRLDGRISLSTVDLQLHDTGEQVMRKLRLNFRDEIRIVERIFVQALLFRKMAVSVARIAPVCPTSLFDLY